jgi:hypothetical protein
MHKKGDRVNNKDKIKLSTYETINDSEEGNIVYTHLHKAKVDCKYSKNGLCNECIITESEKCPLNV